MDPTVIVMVCGIGAGIYLLMNLYALLVSDRLLFVPQTPSYDHLPHEIRIESGGRQTINAVYLEHPRADHVILFSHGNMEDLGNVVPFMQRFHEQGFSVLMYDYRGYGTSEGTPSTRHVKEDVSAAYRWLVETKGIDPERIIAQGRSLGGGVAVWLAATHRVGGLVSEISFASVFRVKTRWKILPWDKFDSLRSIRKVRCPVLVIHGTRDEVIPFRHAEKVFRAAPEPKSHLWIEGGRHRDYVYLAEDKYLESILRFAESLR